MKPSRHFTLSRLSLALIVAFLTTILSTTSWAQPTVQPLAGKTCVELDEAFAKALEDLNISLDIVKPASPKNGDVCFPIHGGGIDLKTLKAQIFHTGGLALIQGDDQNDKEATERLNTVKLTSFIIDTIGNGGAVLTGLVIVNEVLIARLPLFDLDLDAAKIKEKKNWLSIRKVVLTLTEAAATALNGVFFDGKVVLKKDTLIGVANVYAFFFRPDHDDCEK